MRENTSPSLLNKSLLFELPLVQIGGKALLLLIVSLCIFILGCTKKDSQSGAAQGAVQLGGELLSYLPQDAQGYFVFDATTAGYKKYEGSDIYQRMSKVQYDAETLFGNLASGAADVGNDTTVSFSDGNAQINRIITVLGPAIFKKNMLASIKENGIQHVAGYLRVVSQRNLALGLLVQAAKEIKVEEFVKKLRDKGEKVEEITLGKGKGYSLKLISTESSSSDRVKLANPKTEKAQPPFDTIYFASQSGKLAVGTDRDSVGAFLEGKPLSTKLKIQDDAAFKNAKAALSGEAGSYAFGYFDLAKVITKLIPEQQTKDLEVLKHFPVEGLGFSGAFDRVAKSKTAVVFSKQSPHSEKWLQALTVSGSSELLNWLPAKGVLAVEVNGDAVNNAAKLIIEQLPEEERQQAQMSTSTLKSIKDLAISARYMKGSSLFPELLIIGKVADAPTFLGMIKMMAGGAMASQGAGAAGWQQKKVEGVDASFMLTPLGVGIYTATKDDKLLIASSEGMLQSALRAAAGTELSLGKSLGDKQISTGKDSFFYWWIDYAAMADALDGLAGSLAMLGADANQNQEEWMHMFRNMGTAVAEGRVANQVVEFEGYQY